MARRLVAFIIDLIIIAIPLVAAAMFIFVFGLLTFGLGWALFWLLSPASVVWALFYYGLTLGSPASATIGMRVMDIELRTWYGAPAYFLLGAVLVVHFGLEFEVPIWTCFIVIALSVALNVGLRLAFPQTQWIPPDRAAYLLGFDIAELAALLFLWRYRLVDQAFHSTIGKG